MRLPDPSVRLRGIDLHFHWSCWLMPVVVFGQGLYAADWRVATLNAGVTVAFLFGVLLHELLQAWCAARLGVRTRDIYLYPICGYARLGSIGERPRRELWIAVAGIGLGAIFAAMLTLVIGLSGWGFGPIAFDAGGGPEEFFNRLFWCQVLFAVFNALPAFPFDGANLFRSALAMTTSRMRATEVAAALGTLVALGLILGDLLWLHNGLLGALAVFVFVMSQYELAFMKYFFDLHHPQPGDRSQQIGTVAVEQLIDPDSRPLEANFTGFIWTPRSRMWIEWREGQPVSASAILGE